MKDTLTIMKDTLKTQKMRLNPGLAVWSPVDGLIDAHG